MRERIKKVILIGAAVLLCGCAYAVFHIKTGFGVPCVFHLITGWNCPGCGITRMFASLFRHDLASAFRSNAALLCLLPGLLALAAYWIYRYIRYGTQRYPKAAEAVCWALAGIFISWGVVRNLIGM